jgi:hypothetical protein
MGRLAFKKKRFYVMANTPRRPCNELSSYGVHLSVNS